MTRPSPSQARAIWIGVAIPIAATAIMASVKQFSDAKLDVVRFERDSVTAVYERRRIDAKLDELVSTTRRIEASVEELKAETRRR